MAMLPSNASRPRSACAWPMKIRTHPGKGDQRRGNRLRPDRLAEEEGGEEQGDQRGDEGERDRLRQRHLGQSPEEQHRHDEGQAAAEQVDTHGGARRPVGRAANRAPDIATPESIRHNIVG